MLVTMLLPFYTRNKSHKKGLKQYFNASFKVTLVENNSLASIMQHYTNKKCCLVFMLLLSLKNIKLQFFDLVIFPLYTKNLSV
jgi:hypothetical protein